jgi:catechol 2,3-dioxygenase-like lactoylglutathione lyase family enzyme
MKAVAIHHMNVPIDDLAAARDFYGRVLALPELERPDVGRPGLWFGCPPNELHLSVQPDVKGGRTTLSLQPGERPERRGGHVAFTMEGSVDDIARHLEAERIPYARGTAGLPQIFCEDPAGNLVELNTGWAQKPLGARR